MMRIANSFLGAFFVITSCCAFSTLPSIHHNTHCRSTTIQRSKRDEGDDNGDAALDPSQMKWIQSRSESTGTTSPYIDDSTQGEDEHVSGNVHIPKTGISINDEMTEMQMTERYLTKVFPLEVKGVAAIQTVTADTASDELMRYIVPLDDLNGQEEDEEENELGTEEKESEKETGYAMVDIPPYSDDLKAQMQSFFSKTGGGKLSYILITCQTGIHYNEASSVYVTRKSDLRAWKEAFPDVTIVMYRLDIPRDCRGLVTQVLDGYGPWALKNNEDAGTEPRIFEETGRPLTIMEWDEEVQVKVLDEGEMPPDDKEDENDAKTEKLYTPEAIKEREASRDILAVYTPGHTYGSVTYIFPKSKICVSGLTIPVEDTRAGASLFGQPMSAGPKLDYAGYLTTNAGDLQRQVESGRHIATTYSDRFEVVLPARGPAVNLGGYSEFERSKLLHDILDDFAELGRVYNQMGII